MASAAAINATETESGVELVHMYSAHICTRASLHTCTCSGSSASLRPALLLTSSLAVPPLHHSITSSLHHLITSSPHYFTTRSLQVTGKSTVATILAKLGLINATSAQMPIERLKM